MALSACNHRFLTVTAKNQPMAVSEKAKEKEMIKVKISIKSSSIKIIINQ